MVNQAPEFAATGRRKTATAHVRLVAGTGQVLVNNRAYAEYFPVETLRIYIEQPLKATGTVGKFDIKAAINGGGLDGQAGAMRHGIARALLEVDAALRAALKKGGFLTRDSRTVERKKYGRAKARKSFQFSKR